MSNFVDFVGLFGGCYRGRRVLVTGHTGFKGSWLSFWLSRLGAEVVGYSLAPETDPNHWDLLTIDGCRSVLGDIRDVKRLHQVFTDHRPEFVFHLAAQPLVRRSYREPEETFSTNVLGTLNVMRAAAATDSVRAFVCVTSDKVYENRESSIGYVEADRLGGSDPYSASKACTEILATCVRKSFFAGPGSGQPVRMATVRAGNVIGGGDWSEDRLIPDAVRAASGGAPLGIRNPASVRPWQHVLEPLAGYLAVGQRLFFRDDDDPITSWNFGPYEEGSVSVSAVVPHFQRHWPALRSDIASESNAPPETQVLRLDSSLAVAELGWRPLWDWQTAVERTAKWYREFYENREIMTKKDIEDYVNQALSDRVIWAIS